MKFIINNNKKDSNIVFYNYAIKEVYVNTPLTSLKDIKDVKARCNIEMLKKKKIII
jgi:hypothetical protein